jgi:two-component system sensor histidine kinase YesM
LRSRDDKEAYFIDLITASDLSPDTFAEVVIHVGDEFYRGHLSDRAVTYPDAPFLAAMLAGDAGALAYAGNLAAADGTGYLVFARQIETLYPDSERFGVALFYVKPAAVEAALAALTWPQTADAAWSFIRTPDGAVVAAAAGASDVPATAAIEPVYDDFVVASVADRKVIVVASRLDAIGATYPELDFAAVTVIDRDLLFADIDNLNRYVVVLGAVSLVVLAVLASRISERIAKPLKKLVANLREFGRSKTRVATVVADDEIVELEKTYDEMINQILDLIRTNTIEMENKRKLELYALQMQINPHFLYNTLDAIAWMAKIKKQPEIEKLVLALAKFFRISLHKGDKFITVAEEFDLVRNFVAIQAIRFPGLFAVRYELDPAVAELETLKLILQPIVENAIKHGFTGLDRVGNIVIAAKGEGDDVVFEVADDGIGFQPSEDLFSEKRLLDGLGGYGLKNVDERIKLEYGRAYGIRVDSSEGGGTRVRIQIKRTH